MVLGGFQKTIKDKVYAFSGHLLITKYSLSTSYEDTDIRMTDNMLKRLSDAEYVTRWQPYAFKAALLKTKDEVQGVIFKGVDAGFDTTFFNQHLVEGVFPKVGRSEVRKSNYSTEVAMSQKMTRFLELKLGDEVLIYFVQNPPRYRKLQIVGIYETGLEEFDQKLIIGDLDLVRKINGWNDDQVSGVEVFVDSKTDLFWAQEELFGKLDVDMYVQNVEDSYMQIFDWLNLLNRNVLIFLILILVVASFSMVSVLLILIMERTQMVGMLKAMGASDALVRTVFVQLGVRLIVKGLLIGNGIGLMLGWLQYQFKILPLDPVNYYMSYVPIEFNWTAVIFINLLFILLISLSLLIPVTIISRIRPIQAIRFD
jgi:lipoprotein-releasing system permease protein